LLSIGSQVVFWSSRSVLRAPLAPSEAYLVTTGAADCAEMIASSASRGSKEAFGLNLGLSFLLASSFFTGCYCCPLTCLFAAFDWPDEASFSTAFGYDACKGTFNLN